MKYLYLDCFSGISGDMLLGALLDLGVDGERLVAELAKLNLFGFDIEIKKANKYAITGTDVYITVHDDATHDHNHAHEHVHEHEHPHEHVHEHEHTHEHGLDQHSHEHEHSHPVERSLRDIIKIIDDSGLNADVKDMSKRVFTEIAAAEGYVHNVPAEDVHFHEIGAVDSIVDIVGACVCVRILGADEIYASELHDGRGYVDTRHGRLPVPAPAVLAMLTGGGIPLVTEEIPCELVTPTGIGLAKTLVKSFGPMPAMKIERAGYGFGKRDTGRLNALRAILGESIAETKPEPGTVDEIISLETNIDDMTAEALGYAMERLLAEGALDVYFTPIVMKKNRPATMLTVLCAPEAASALTDAVFRETTTLGVRKSRFCRDVMERKSESVDIGPYGAVRVKTAARKDVVRRSPEYEDCKQYARKAGIPLADVYELARNAYLTGSNIKETHENKI